jgi:hypothetical protein
LADVALRIEKLPLNDFRCAEPAALVLALGFEERTRVSAERLLTACRPKKVVLVRLDEEGRSAATAKLASDKTKNVTFVAVRDVLSRGLSLGGSVLVDVTGMPKSVIFSSIRTLLSHNKEVFVCRTGALAYRPSEREISRIILAENDRDHYKLLKRMAELQMGESGPYELIRLLPSEADESRRVALSCFSSAKFERLLSFLDERAYDRIEIGTPLTKTNRSICAKIAAEVAARTYPATTVTELDCDDLGALCSHIVGRYQHWYVNAGMNFEMALTGSKLDSVACGAVGAAFKIAQCWALKAKNLDVDNYSVGVGQTRCIVSGCRKEGL